MAITILIWRWLVITLTAPSLRPLGRTARSSPALSGYSKNSQAKVTYSFSFAGSLQCELPEHTVLSLVEELSAIYDPPEAHVLPTTDRELVEERHGMTSFYRTEQSTVAGAQTLVASPPFARVADALARFMHTVWIAGVDAAEVCQERDQPAATMIDTVLDTMCTVDLGPGEDFS